MVKCARCHQEKGEKYWEPETDEWLCRTCYYGKEKDVKKEKRVSS